MFSSQASGADLPKLRQAMTELFSENEIRTVCFDLDIDFEDLKPGGKSDKIRELVALCVRTQRTEALLNHCAKIRPGFHWQTITVAKDDGLSPFKGLQFYDVEDAPRFFGREAWTAQLIRRLSPGSDETDPFFRFLAVVGASGSGKSSLVRAGLIPALKRGQPLSDGSPPPDGCEKWPVYLLTPTDQPVKALATSLTQDVDSVRITTTLIDDMVQESRSLDIYLRKLLAKSAANNLLIVIDQFEELFSLCHDERERQMFIQNLTTAVASGSAGPAYVIITLRADFYHRCADYDDLRSLLAVRQEYIGPMNKSELRRAIQEPALQQGLQFEDGLVDRLLQEVGSEPGSLPLLSHALHETWKRRQGTQLTHVGYQASGGVRGAIAQTAENTYTRLSPDQQRLMQLLFLRLTELGEETEDTRRRVPFAELLTLSQGEGQMAPLLKKLADNRLITTGWDAVEVAHEALIREWPRLRNWLDENRAGLRTHRQLTEAAHEWDSNGQDTSYLYRGARLVEAEEWAADHAEQLSPQEQNFLGISITARRTEQRKSRRRVQYTISGLAAAVIIFSALALLAWRQRNDAVALQQKILAQELTTNANNLIGQDNELALLLALEAVQRDHSFETEDVLRRALRQPIPSVPPIRHPGLRVMMFSPDGHQLITAGDDTFARIWQWPEGDLITTLEGHTGWIVDVDFNPHQEQIVTASIDGTVRIWDAHTGAETMILSLPINDPLNARFWHAKFSPDGCLIVTGRADGQVHLWDARTGELVQTLPSHTGDVTAVAFHPSSQIVLTAGEDGVAALWRINDEESTLLIGHEGKIWAARFSPDGRFIGTAGFDGTAILWDVATGEPLHTLSGPRPNVASNSWSPGVINIAFSPDSQQVVTTGHDGIARVWDTQTGQLRADLVGHKGIVQAAIFNSPGNRLLTISQDETARLWDASSGEELLVYSKIVPNTNGEANTIPLSFDPSGQKVLGVAEEGQVLVWDATPPSGDMLSVLPGSIGAFSKENDRYVSSTLNSVTVWDTNSWKIISNLENIRGDNNYIYDVSLSPEGTMVIGTYGTRWTIVEQNQVGVWDAATGQNLTTLGQFVTLAKFSPDGHYFYTDVWDEPGKLYLTSTLDEVPLPNGADISYMYFSNCPNILIVKETNGTTSHYKLSEQSVTPLNLPASAQIFCDEAGRSLMAIPDDLGKITIENLNTGEEILTASGQNGVFSPDGKYFATPHAGAMWIWELQTGEVIQNIPLDFWPVGYMFFSPDSRNIVILRRSGGWEVWHIDTLELIATGYPNFSPDGSLIISVQEDSTLNSLESFASIHKATTGEIISILQANTNAIDMADFTPDGHYALTSSLEEGFTRIWLLSLEALIAAAEQKAPRRLTCEERQVYLHEGECAPASP